MSVVIEELGFHNPLRPGLHVETFTLAELRRRVTAEHLARHLRLGFHQLLLIEAGTGQVTIDFVTHDCRPGTVFWIRPDQVQQGVAAGTVDGQVVLFTAEFLPAVPVLVPVLDDIFGSVRWRPDSNRRAAIVDGVHQLARDYATACGSGDPPGPADVELLRHQLVVLLLRVAALSDGSAGADLRANTVFHLFRQSLERYFAQSRTVADHAARTGHSVKTINRACRAVTGHSAKQVVDRRVILEAKRLLVHTDEPVAAIARRLGFDEATNFGKYFAHHTGSTPGAFRADHVG